MIKNNRFLVKRSTIEYRNAAVDASQRIIWLVYFFTHHVIANGNLKLIALFLIIGNILDSSLERSRISLSLARGADW